MHRTPLIAGRAAVLAVIGALAYAVEGAIVIHSPQPDHHWSAAGYAVEVAFAIALVATIPLLPLLATSASRTAAIAARVAQVGLGAMLVDAVASTVAGGNVVGPLFFLGLLAALGGLIVLAIWTVRARLGTWWLAPVVLVTLLAGMALGDHGGGILIGVGWAIVAFAIRGSGERAVMLTARA
jgi:hypothetical protein